MLFTDACSGQNKNKNMMFLLNYILKYRTFKHVEHYFPIRGHSYMPPDRELRKKDTIIEPNGYHKVCVTVTTVNVLGIDWVISNFMDTSKKALVKKNLPLKCISNMFSSIQKSIILILALKTHNDLPTTVKVTKSTELLHEAYKKQENHIRQKKRQDVEKLPKFITLSEHARMFYQNALSDNVEGD
ncbi:hypothetical protein PR048_025101 [Dryococelus australis]|uniref:Uncharacterized protein n=1 Tax=Dryococelus australis TaxID=614101 RepID=A0ABQ9GQH4_9NEOP|nr:hypothetical protein PR048_025101 [Dryococelus australis]